MLSEREKLAMFYGAILSISSDYAKTDMKKANRFFDFGMRECIRLYIKDGENNNHKDFVNELTEYSKVVRPDFSQKEKRQYA